MGIFDGIVDAATGGSGLGSIIGSVISGGLGYAGQTEANNANIDMANRQMQFQEQMSSTAYQRAVKDMQAAGLNPMLAYSQGGASAPLGSMPVIGNRGSAAAQAAASGASASAASAQAGKTAIEHENARLEQGNIEAVTDRNRADADLARTNADKAKTDMMFTVQGLLPKAIADAEASGASAAHFKALVNQINTILPAQLANMIADTGLKESHSAESVAQTGLIRQQTYSEPVRRALLGEEVKRTRSETGLNDLQNLLGSMDYPGKKNQHDFDLEHPNFGPYAGAAGKIASAASAALGGLGAGAIGGAIGRKLSEPSSPAIVYRKVKRP